MISVPNLDTLPSHRELEYCIRARTHVLAYSSASLTWLAAAAGFRAVGEPRDEGQKRRQRVVLARRESATLPAPTSPLDAARASLTAFFDAGPDGTSARRLPVRLRAALRNWRRLHRAPGDRP
jgi:hypothetical protein